MHSLSSSVIFEQMSMHFLREASYGSVIRVVEEGYRTLQDGQHHLGSSGFQVDDESVITPSSDPAHVTSLVIT